MNFCRFHFVYCDMNTIRQEENSNSFKFYLILRLAEDYGFYLILSQAFEPVIKKRRSLYILIGTSAPGKLFNESLKSQVCGKQLNILLLFTVLDCIATAFFSSTYGFCQSCTFKRQFSWFRKIIRRFNGLHWSYFKQLIFSILWASWDKQEKWCWSDLFTFHCSFQWLTI